VTFGIEPATAKGRDGRPNLAWGVTPGALLTDHVALVNYSTKPLHLSVYATDAYTSQDGGFGLLRSDQKPSDAGSWISLGAPVRHVVVPPRSPGSPGQKVISVTARIPANAQPGDHDAGVLAVLTAYAQNASGARVKLEQRVGTRVFIRVAGDLKPQLTVQDLHASYHSSANPLHAGSVEVTYTVANTGNTNLAATGTTTVSGVFGSHSVAGVPVVPVLLPGGAVKVQVTVPGIWPQVWMKASVNVIAKPVVGDTLPAVPAATATTSFWAIPWVLVALLLLLALAIGAWWWRRRRPRPVPPVGDELSDKPKAEVAK
jgi:hypothetical protein